MRPLRLCILSAVAVSAALQGCRHLPRMDRQASIRPYEQRMPQTPPGSVPRRVKQPVPTAEAAGRLPNPIPRTDGALARGRLYYGYYCAMCHGPEGRGHAPVGESYHPAPADLSSAQVQSLSDGKLFRAMAVGTGHEPTLAYVAEAERRWYIVHHVRTLAESHDSGPVAE
ncbi:MAG: cytochrome C [Armatimonadota bacterium]